ncbi:MAG TPA: hypothetical protein VGQ36_24765 [Thermoanaerobaculia bacterium]|jgi:hypothetical protein|nr:hypothetical protein [Thermoanaerobaculia bacterium]
MLVIRKAQLAAFAAAADARFVTLLCASVRAAEPDAVAALDDESLEANMTVALSRARRYGIADAVGIGEFFMAMLLHGPRFDEVPALRDFLDGVRIHALWRDAPKDALAEAARMPRPEWWRVGP